MIEQLLSKAGFSDKQIALIIALGESDGLSVRQLVAQCKLPRSSVYLLLDELAKRQLVQTNSVGSSVRYKLASIASFERMLNEEMESLRSKQVAISAFVELMKARQTAPSLFPKLHFVSGRKEILHFLYDRWDTWRRSCEGKVSWWGYQDDVFVDQYFQWLQHAWTNAKPQEKVQLFSNTESLVQERERKIPGRTIRPLPPSLKLASTLWVVGEFVVMISTRGRPHYCFELRDSTLAANLQSMFQLMWK